MVETEDITDDNGGPVPDRLRHQWQHAPILEPGQCAAKLGYKPEDDSQVNFADKIAPSRGRQA